MTYMMKKRLIALAAACMAAAAFNAPAADAPVSSPAAPLGAPQPAPTPTMPHKMAKRRHAPSAPQDCEAQWPGCPCPQDLAALQKEIHITPPAGMSLAAGSCSRRAGTIELGSFTFTGAVTLKGAVVSWSDDMFDHLNFTAAPPKSISHKYTTAQMRQFAGALYDLRINDPEKFSVPQGSANTSRCMEADAVIKVGSIEVVIGGTDEEGTWLRDYEVIKLGKYRKCAPATAAAYR